MKRTGHDTCCWLCEKRPKCGTGRLYLRTPCEAERDNEECRGALRPDARGEVICQVCPLFKRKEKP